VDLSEVLNCDKVKEQGVIFLASMITLTFYFMIMNRE